MTILLFTPHWNYFQTFPVWTFLDISSQCPCIIISPGCKPGGGNACHKVCESFTIKHSVTLVFRHGCISHISSIARIPTPWDPGDRHPCQHRVFSDALLLYSGKRRLLVKQTRTKTKTYLPPFPQILGKIWGTRGGVWSIKLVLQREPFKASQSRSLAWQWSGNSAGGGGRGVGGGDAGFCVMGTWGLCPADGGEFVLQVWTRSLSSIFPLSPTLSLSPLKYKHWTRHMLSIFCNMFPRHSSLQMSENGPAYPGLSFFFTTEREPTSYTQWGKGLPAETPQSVRNQNQKTWKAYSIVALCSPAFQNWAPVSITLQEPGTRCRAPGGHGDVWSCPLILRKVGSPFKNTTQKNNQNKLEGQMLLSLRLWLRPEGGPRAVLQGHLTKPSDRPWDRVCQLGS